MTIDENYTERLVDAVIKTIVEVFENLTITDVNMYQLGYTKAIDDFAGALKGNIVTITFGARACDIDKVAEQLKAGAVDG